MNATAYNTENMNRVNNEPTALRGATLQEIERKSDRTAAPAWLKPGATFKRTTSNGREVVAICTRLLLDGFAYITANCFGVVDHVTAFAAFDFDGVTPCDIDDDAPKFARMMRNFQRIRKEFEEYQTAHPYTEQSDTTTDTTNENEPEAAYLSPVYSASEKLSEPAEPLADIISEAKQQEARTVSGLNYGPIKYLRDRVLYATNGKTTAENLKEYEANLHRVTDADTFAAYLLSSYDVFVDETQVFCDLRRAFPSLTFAELCRLIRDHMGENQQGNGIAAALVPDCVILASSDEYTRRTFAERHKKYNRRTADGGTGTSKQTYLIT